MPARPCNSESTGSTLPKRALIEPCGNAVFLRPDYARLPSPAETDIQFKWRGHEIEGDQLLVFPEDGELDSVSDSRFHVYTCSFPAELLASIADRDGLAAADLLNQGSGVIPCSSQHLAQIRELLRTITSVVRSARDVADPETIRHAIAQQLPNQLLSAISEAKGLPAPAAITKRELAVTIAIKFMESFADQPIQIRDVVAKAGVSQRTLEYGFRDKLGVTPKAYLFALRMSHVHRELRSAAESRLQSHRRG